jgi:hypothetical protein
MSDAGTDADIGIEGWSLMKLRPADTGLPEGRALARYPD